MALFFMDKLTLGDMQGNLLAIGSGAFFAGAMVSFRAQKDGSALESILISHMITFVVALPFIIGGGWPRAAEAGLLPAALPLATSVLIGAAALLFLGVFQIGIASLLLSYGVKHVTALQSLLICVLEPILNPVWVFLVMGERPGPRALAGGAIILVAVTARSVLSLRPAARPAGAG